MEQGTDSSTGTAHETSERDAYARFDRLAEGIELSAADQARVDRAVRSVREPGYAIVTGLLDGERTRRAREELAAVFELPDHLVIKGKRLPAGGGENTIHVCNLFATVGKCGRGTPYITSSRCSTWFTAPGPGRIAHATES